MKLLKTYESFREPFKYEEEVIDPILIYIRENQEYLTIPENLSQLAKLGYMYNTLWYNGRLCWGSGGILLSDKVKKMKGDEKYEYISCEDNPKYKIEMCYPINDDIENLIYDCWGMHVSDDDLSNPGSEKFIDIIKNGEKLTPIQKKELKINKTIEDWIEIKTDASYKYKSLYPDAKSVIDNLLFVTGTGYDWNKDGFIIEEAGGADQDRALYGDWKNAKFKTEIQIMVDSIIKMPEVIETLNTSKKYDDDEKNKRNKKKNDDDDDFLKRVLLKYGSDKKVVDDLEKIKKKLISIKSTKVDKVREYSQYYPVSKSSSIYAILDKEIQNRIGIKKFDQSYINAGIESCKDIVKNSSKERKENIEFAKKFLSKIAGIREYDADIPKELDKYGILETIEDYFCYVTDKLRRSIANSDNNLEKGEFILYMNDSKFNQYADNNYHFSMSLKGYNLSKGYYTNLECLKSTPIYTDIMSCMNRISKMEDIKNITTYCDVVGGDYDPLLLKISMFKDKSIDDVKENDEYLSKIGFGVGSNLISLELNNIIIVSPKPTPLGKSHPDNKGREYYSTSHYVNILDKNWNKLFDFNIDERGFNTINIQLVTTGNDAIKKWIKNEFTNMKSSDPDYGTYGAVSGKGSQGKKKLYAIDFMLWLKNHQK